MEDGLTLPRIIPCRVALEQSGTVSVQTPARSPFVDAKQGGLAIGPAPAFALDAGCAEIASVNLDHAEEGFVRLAGPMDAFAKSAVDSVDGVTVKPCQLGCLQGCQISGEAANDLPNFALGQMRTF